MSTNELVLIFCIAAIVTLVILVVSYQNGRLKTRCTCILMNDNVIKKCMVQAVLEVEFYSFYLAEPTPNSSPPLVGDDRDHLV